MPFVSGRRPDADDLGHLIRTASTSNAFASSGGSLSASTRLRLAAHRSRAALAALAIDF
jgi:hypothetical protein